MRTCRSRAAHSRVNEPAAATLVIAPSHATARAHRGNRRNSVLRIADLLSAPSEVGLIERRHRKRLAARPAVSDFLALVAIGGWTVSRRNHDRAPTAR